MEEDAGHGSDWQPWPVMPDGERARVCHPRASLGSPYRRSGCERDKQRHPSSRPGDPSRDDSMQVRAGTGPTEHGSCDSGGEQDAVGRLMMPAGQSVRDLGDGRDIVPSFRETVEPGSSMSGRSANAAATTPAAASWLDGRWMPARRAAGWARPSELHLDGPSGIWMAPAEVSPRGCDRIHSCLSDRLRYGAQCSW
jgi:hypothetical protein